MLRMICLKELGAFPKIVCVIVLLCMNTGKQTALHQDELSVQLVCSHLLDLSPLSVVIHR